VIRSMDMFSAFGEMGKAGWMSNGTGSVAVGLGATADNDAGMECTISRFSLPHAKLVTFLFYAYYAGLQFGATFESPCHLGRFLSVSPRQHRPVIAHKPRPRLFSLRLIHNLQDPPRALLLRDHGHLRKGRQLLDHLLDHVGAHCSGMDGEGHQGRILMPQLSSQLVRAHLAHPVRHHPDRHTRAEGEARREGGDDDEL